MKKNEQNTQVYLKDFLFVILFGIISFYFTALLSYNALDATINSASYPPIPDKNLAGAIGAELSGFVIYYLGLGSFLIPLPFLLVLIANYKNKFSLRSTMVFFFSSISIYIGLIYAFATFLPNVSLQGVEISTLGAFGLWFSKTIYLHLGKIGSPIVSLTICLLGIVVLNRENFIFSKLRELQNSQSRK